jgi:hypothetical protein
MHVCDIRETFVVVGYVLTYVFQMKSTSGNAAVVTTVLCAELGTRLLIGL